MVGHFNFGIPRLPGLLIGHFVLVWFCVLVIAVAYGVVASGCIGSIKSRTVRSLRSSGSQQCRTGQSLTDVLALIVFAVFIVLCVVIMLYKEDFAYYDNDQLTDFSLRGVSFAPPIWTGSGRFFPLGFQEFNLLALITKSPAGFHAIAAAQLILVAWALLVILDDYRMSYRVLIVMTAMLAPSFVIAFTGLIYPERNIIFWLVMIMLCLDRYVKTNSPVYVVGCLVATQFVLYYKETVVVFIACYAGSRLWWEASQARRDGSSWEGAIQKGLLSLGMLCLAAIWGLLFLVTIVGHGQSSYLAAHHQTPGVVFLAYLQTDWVPFILAATLCARSLEVVRSNGEFDPLWDCLGVGAIAYFFAIIGLRMVSGYYMAPVDLVGIVYVGRIALRWLATPTMGRVTVAVLIVACLWLHNVAYSAFRIVERKSLIANRKELAEFVHNYPSRTGKMELFFPYGSQYHLMGVSSYLRYKDVPLAGVQDAPADKGRQIVIEGAGPFPHNRCVEYREYSCTHVDTPGDGALIIVLPDDDVSMGEAEMAGRGSELLLSLNTCEICTERRSWFRLLHAISAEVASGQLPEHWMHLDIFRKQSAVAAPGLRQASITAPSGE